MKPIGKVGNYTYYELTDEEIFLYKHMEKITYEKGIEIETELVENVLSIKGSNILVKCIITYFEKLSEDTEYKNKLRKHKLNSICLKLVK
jgi:hypothetical protein